MAFKKIVVVCIAMQMRRTMLPFLAAAGVIVAGCAGLSPQANFEKGHEIGSREGYIRGFRAAEREAAGAKFLSVRYMGVSEKDVPPRIVILRRVEAFNSRYGHISVIPLYDIDLANSFLGFYVVPRQAGSSYDGFIREIENLAAPISK